MVLEKFGYEIVATDCSEDMITYTIYEMNHNGIYTSLKEMQKNRYFLVQKMARRLSSCGFTPVKWFTEFAHEENITGQTWHIVCIARKSSESAVR